MCNIIKYIKTDEHSTYMSCAQYSDWLVDGFNSDSKDAYIVQEIMLEMLFDGILDYKHYYEAWKIEQGLCCKEEGQLCDDILCIGHRLDDTDALKKSIGHYGKVVFKPKVYFIKIDSVLYNEIDSWPENIVKEANGLKAIYYSEKVSELFENCESFKREEFCHCWDFRDYNLIYNTVLDYCIRNYKKNNLDERNLYLDLDDIFSDVSCCYRVLKQEIINSWKAV